MESIVSKWRPVILTAGAFLAHHTTSSWSNHGHCGHGYCVLMDDVSWLLRCITYARSSLALIMLSGIALYYVPETRAPVKKGCHLAIDFIANGLKAVIGPINDSDDDICNGNPENPLRIPLIPSNFEGNVNECSQPEKRESLSISFKIPNSELSRQRRRQCKLHSSNENVKCRHRRHRCIIREPYTMNRKEKSSVEKVSIYPLPPLMQFDTFERQNLNIPFPSSNNNCKLCLKRWDNETVKNNKSKGKKHNSSCYVRVQNKNKNLEDLLKEYNLNEDINNKICNLSEVEICEWTESEFFGKPQKWNQNNSTNNADRHVKATSFSNAHIQKSILAKSKKSNAIHKQKVEHSTLPLQDRNKKSERNSAIKPNESNKPYSSASLNNINKNFQQKGVPYCCHANQLQEYTKSPLSRAFDWIFRGCPNAKRQPADKKLSTLVKATMSDYYE